MKDLNILIMTSSFPKFPDDHVGAFVLEDAMLLSSINYKIWILTPYQPKAKFRENINKNINVIRFRWTNPSKFKHFTAFNLLDYLRLPSLILSFLANAIIIVLTKKIHLIHSYWAIPSGLIGFVIALLTRKPLVVSVLGSDLRVFGKKEPFRALIQIILDKSHKIITSSHNLYDISLRMGATKEKVVTIPLNVDLKMFKPRKVESLREDLGIQPQDFVILFVGNLLKVKGVNILIKSYIKVLKKHPKTRLIIVGDGPERESLEKLARTLDISQEVIFTGRVNRSLITKHYNIADLFVLPSFSEGFGMVLLEALACGKPVIGSRIGGIPEIIKDGFNGLLTTPGDVNELAIKINYIIENPEISKIYGQNGIKIAFKCTEIANQRLFHFYQIFSELISHR